MPIETALAYTAGLFDGEGSITLTRTKRTRFRSPQVSVASCDREVLEWLRITFGGSICYSLHISRLRLVMDVTQMRW